MPARWRRSWPASPRGGCAGCLQELPGQRVRIAAAVAACDEAGVRGELHRLVASCGFVGAARLAQAVHRLQQAPLEAEALQQLFVAIEELPASA